MKLLDYKGKFGIAVDNDYVLDEEHGEMFISEDYPRDIFISVLEKRHSLARYYGIPVYIGKDKEINEIIEKLDVEYDKQII